MRRRSFLAGLFGVVAAPLAPEAQPPGKAARTSIPRVGVLSPLTSAQAAVDIGAFREGIRDLGYLDGQNIAIEPRWAEARPERLQLLAVELVHLNMDVIVTNGEPAIRALREATRTIPIVVAIAGDLVAAGHAVSLARPGGHVTGFIDMAPDLAAKRVQLLKELVPGLTRIAVLWNVGSPLKAHEYRETEAGARALGLQLQSLGVRDPNDFETKLKEAASEHAGAMVVLQDPLTTGQSRRIARLAAEGHLPTIFGLKDGVDAGGLLAYGHSPAAYYRRAAVYVDKILKGAKPGDLPIQQRTTFEFIINLKTAKALALTIPQAKDRRRMILQRADG